jgi:hypothetical protein
MRKNCNQQGLLCEALLHTTQSRLGRKETAFNSLDIYGAASSSKKAAFTSNPIDRIGNEAALFSKIPYKA